MAKKLLLLERDGTVTRNKVSPGSYIRHPGDLELVPGILPRLEQHSADGWRIALVSNQGGIEKGTISLDVCVDTFYQAFKLTKFLVQAAWFCPAPSGCKGELAFRLTMPHGPKSWTTCRAYNNYGYRKPCPGMVMAAIAWFGVKPENCLLVSDRIEDKNMARLAGISFLYSERFIEDGYEITN